MTRFLLTLLIGLPGALAAQTYELDIRWTEGTPPNENPLYIWELVGSELTRVDSLVPAEGQHDLSAAGHPGVYRLGFYPMQATEIALGQEKQVSILLRRDSRSGSLTANTVSIEGKAHRRLRTAMQDYSDTYRDISRRIRQKMQAKGDSPDMTAEFNAKVDSLGRRFDTLLDSIAGAFPETYTTQILLPLVRPVLPPAHLTGRPRQLYGQRHFLDHVDFSNPLTLYNDILDRKLMQYLVQGVQIFGPERCPETIDSLMARAEPSPAVSNYIVNTLLQTFHKRGPQEMVRYTLKNYGSALTDTLSGTEPVFERLEAMKPGKPAPPVTMADTSGTERSLMDELGEELTLLYVWSANCHHCREKSPAVFDLYQMYKNRGFNVFAAGMDRNKDEWVSGIKELGLAWTNVSDQKSWQSPVIEAYGIRRTPFMVLMDSEGKIVKYNLTVAELRQTLRERLGPPVQD